MTSRPRKTRSRPQLNVSSLGVFGVLSALAKNDEAIGVLEVARRLDVPASTAHRALATLESCGFVAREEDTARYHLGNEARRLTNAFFNMFPLRGVSMLYLRRLALLTGHTAALWVRIGSSMVKIAEIEGSHEVVNQRPIGQSLDLHDCIAGTALLRADAAAAKARKTKQDVGISGFVAGQSAQASEFATPVTLPEIPAFASIVIEAAVRFSFEPYGGEARRIVAALEEHLLTNPNLAFNPFAHLATTTARRPRNAQ